MNFYIAMRTETASIFARAIQKFDRTRPVWILGHNHADGLSPTALFARAFGIAAWTARTRIVGRRLLWNKIVMAANAGGYRPGWVHFAVRSSEDRDLAGFLAGYRPSGADRLHGSGHRHATSGALQPAGWNAFITGPGFSPGSILTDTAVLEVAA